MLRCKISVVPRDFQKSAQKAGQWSREFIENDELFGHHDSDVEYEI